MTHSTRITYLTLLAGLLTGAGRLHAGVTVSDTSASPGSFQTVLTFDQGAGMNTPNNTVVPVTSYSENGYTLMGSFALAKGSVPGQALGITDSMGHFDPGTYAVVGSASSTQTASLTLSMPSGPINVSGLSLLWGSLDSYNKISFQLSDGTTSVFKGDQLGLNPDQKTAYEVYFTAGAGEKITGVTFSSANAAFEFDNVAVQAAPEPATWALLGAGLGLLALVARRHRPEGALV